MSTPVDCDLVVLEIQVRKTLKVNKINWQKRETISRAVGIYGYRPDKGRRGILEKSNRIVSGLSVGKRLI
jgi:hypothetical protein